MSKKIVVSVAGGGSNDEIDLIRRITMVPDAVSLTTTPGGGNHLVVDSKGVTHSVVAASHRGVMLRWGGVALS